MSLIIATLGSYIQYSSFHNEERVLIYSLMAVYRRLVSSPKVERIFEIALLYIPQSRSDSLGVPYNNVNSTYPTYILAKQA